MRSARARGLRTDDEAFQRPEVVALRRGDDVVLLAVVLVRRFCGRALGFEALKGARWKRDRAPDEQRGRGRGSLVDPSDLPRRVPARRRCARRCGVDADDVNETMRPVPVSQRRLGERRGWKKHAQVEGSDLSFCGGEGLETFDDRLQRPAGEQRHGPLGVKTKPP
eukprot:Amastigsp_a679049_13.p4 type:complete len:166 gc:universal Amastigsp_a679049_13:1623-1126(-)